MSGKKELETSVTSKAHVRITLTSTKLDALEKTCRAYSKNVSNMKNGGVKVRGPIRLPTKVLTVYCRKSPVGQGTATFDHYQMRLHKRYMDVYAPIDVVRSITNVNLDSGVDVDVAVLKA